MNAQTASIKFLTETYSMALFLSKWAQFTKERDKGWLLEGSYLKAELFKKKKKLPSIREYAKTEREFYSNLANCWDQNGTQYRGQNKSRWNWKKIKKNVQYKCTFSPLGSHIRFWGFCITPTTCDRLKQTHGRKCNFYDSKLIANAHHQQAWSGPWHSSVLSQACLTELIFSSLNYHVSCFFIPLFPRPGQITYIFAV